MAKRNTNVTPASDLATYAGFTRWIKSRIAQHQRAESP